MKTNRTQFYWPCMVQETCRKKWLPFELLCAVEIVTLNKYPVVTRCILWTDPICLVHQEPNRQQIASIWAYMCTILRLQSNNSHCMSIPKFTDLICSVQQDPSRQKVASIWAYMCSILWVHSKHSLFLSKPQLTDLICSVHQDLSRPKSGFCLSLYVQYA